METRDVQVRSLFGNEVQYIIPLFQRHYVWDKEAQWEPLWRDLMEKVDQRFLEHQIQQYTHFTGAIVIQQNLTIAGDVPKYEIIDGQQRLTTFQITLCALRDICKSYKFDDIATEANRFILNQGFSLYESDDDRYKLIPTEFDRASFISLADQRVGSTSGRILETYDYFKNEIGDYVNRDRDKMLALFRSILNDFGFVQILLNQNDQPERIFESLNARAKPLLQFDLLRNNLFLRAREEEDKDVLYKTYWKHFESPYWESEVRVGRSKITLSELFFQHFLTAKLGEEDITPLYSMYQRRCLRDNDSVKYELSDLKRYSEVYHEMTACSPDSEIGREMSFYKIFDIATLHPLLLFLINELGVSGPELSKVLKIMESYTMRRLVCHRQGVRSYTKLICKLIQRLKGNSFDLGYFIKLLSAETAKSTRWPVDSEIKTFLTLAWANQSINPKVIRYVLYRIELMKRKVNPLLETNQLIFDNKLSLEHIMPEKWKEHWSLPLTDDVDNLSDNQIYFKDMFSPEYKRKNKNWETESSEEGLVDGSYQHPFQLAQERSMYLQSIGNLTLVTGKLNSKMSNNPFSDKRVALEENSVLMLNKEVCGHNTWDTNQIRDRGNKLYTIFCKIWPSSDDFAKDVPYTSNPPVDIPLYDEQESDLEKEDLVQEGSKQFYPQQYESPPADLHLSKNHHETVQSQQRDKDMRSKTSESGKVPNDSELLKDTKEAEFTEGSHLKPEVQGKPLSLLQEFTVKGKRISLNAQQVEELKTVYKADKKLNPKAGPGGAVKKVLVQTGIIPPQHTNNAWNAVARIVGHLTPAQKRATKVDPNE